MLRRPRPPSLCSGVVDHRGNTFDVRGALANAGYRDECTTTADVSVILKAQEFVQFGFGDVGTHLDVKGLQVVHIVDADAAVVHQYIHGSPS